MNEKTIVFFIISMCHHRARSITDLDLTASVHEYDEYSGRRSLLIFLGLSSNTPFVETYSLLSPLLGNGYKVLGHGYPMPVITFHPQGEWMDLEYR